MFVCISSRDSREAPGERYEEARPIADQMDGEAEVMILSRKRPCIRQHVLFHESMRFGMFSNVLGIGSILHLPSYSFFFFKLTGIMASDRQVDQCSEDAGHHRALLAIDIKDK